MNILILGAGNMASAIAKHLHRTGHRLSIASRTEEKSRALAAAYDGARALPLHGAAAGHDLIVVATPYEAAAAALRASGASDDAVVLDMTNPLTPDYMGLTVGHDDSAAETIARALPRIRVVKGFNTLFAQVLAAGATLADGRTASVFLASDSAEAKATVGALAREIGFITVDAGPLKNARYLEPLAGLNVYFGYGAGRGTAIAPAWLGEAA